MRLTDRLFRRGHLSERALVDALLTGDRPAHLDRCDICADRAVDLGRWLDDVRVTGVEAADAAFSPERLAKQQTQILRRLEQLEQPARVIAFPSQTRLNQSESGDRRVAPAWVGVAAAAGLVLGVVGGQMSARIGAPVQPAIPATTTALSDEPPPMNPANTPRLDMELEGLSIPAFDDIDGITPRMLTVSTRIGG
ncbi:MAG TPA: hypothetical protein VES67_00565 [Vicinamibacterales bacterium]|nr:hypothetical protein [Vicinamibacterales bacterium]